MLTCGKGGSWAFEGLRKSAKFLQRIGLLTRPVRSPHPHDVNSPSGISSCSGFPAGSEGKAPACNAGRSLGRRGPLEKEMATHSSWQSRFHSEPSFLRLWVAAILVTGCVCMASSCVCKDRERETDRERDKETQRGRDRERDIHTEKQRDRT